MYINKMLWVSCVIFLVIIGCGDSDRLPRVEPPEVVDSTPDLQDMSMDIVDLSGDVGVDHSEMSIEEDQTFDQRPCLRWENDAGQPITQFDAGEAYLDTPEDHLVYMVNCGQVPLTLRWPQMGDERQFWIKTPDVPRPFDRETYYVTLESGERQVLTVSIALIEEPARFDDAITVFDVQEQRYTLPVTVQGLGCPPNDLMVEGRVRVSTGVSSTYNNPVCARELDTVEFRAFNAMNNQNIERIEWRVQRMPLNSSVRLVPSNTVKKPSLFLDLGGEYVIDVITFSTRGKCRMTDRVRVMTEGCALP